MTLSWSRHQYVEFVFDQKVETWLRLHRNALAWFSGVPERVVIDATATQQAVTAEQVARAEMGV